MDPGLVLDGAEDLVDRGVEDRSLYLSGVDRESLLVVELLVLSKASLVLAFPRNSGSRLAFLRSLGLLRVTVSGLL